MIKTLSPYYLTIPYVAPLSGLTCTSFTLKLFFWNGLKSSPPTEATYEITKENPETSTGNVRIDISRYINDFITFNPSASSTTELLNGNNQLWVKAETFYTTTSPSDLTTPTNQIVSLALKGYAYGLDGENATTPANKILIPIVDYKVSRNSTFVVPLVIDETPPAIEPSIILNSVTLVTGTTYRLNYTINFEATETLLQYNEFPEALYITAGMSSGAIGTHDGDIDIPLTGTIQFRCRAFDPTSSTNINSNVVILEI
jgi:hypothetical protein